MDDHVRILENVETDHEPRIVLENPETDDENCLSSSDESGSDDEAILDLQNVQLDETERAIRERPSSGPCKIAEFVSEDCYTAAQTSFGMPTLDGMVRSFRNEQETLATQAQARRVPSRLPEKEVTPYESPLFNSCFKILFEMTNGAYREKCPDLMEFLTEELTQVQKRFKVLVTVGNDAGYGSPSFQRAVVAWRKTLHMATDPVSQEQQAKNPWGALTFEQTLERLRNPKERSAHAKYKKATKWKADPPSGDNFNRNIESVAISCEVTFRLLHEATGNQRPEVLLELLLEDLQHVQRRQQVLLRAEMATAINPPKQMVEQATCNDGLSNSILTAGRLSAGRESMNPIPQLVPNPISSVHSPFTASQWVEFEYQTLIFKYIMAGVRVMNVPNEILDPICKSVASTNRTASHPAPNLGSGAVHLGVANNTDPEPGRCRRTDGKKWRCAREVVPEQKYCERHKHRERHRSSPAASSGQIQLQAAL